MAFDIQKLIAAQRFIGYHTKMPNKNDSKKLEEIRHSLAHLLAAAVMELYPDAKRTIGPAIENGF